MAQNVPCFQNGILCSVVKVYKFQNKKLGKTEEKSFLPGNPENHREKDIGERERVRQSQRDERNRERQRQRHRKTQ